MPPIYVILTEGYSDWEIAVQCGVGPSFYEADIGFLLTSGSALISAGGLQIVDPVPLSPTWKACWCCAAATSSTTFAAAGW